MYSVFILLYMTIISPWVQATAVPKAYAQVLTYRMVGKICFCKKTIFSPEVM